MAGRFPFATVTEAARCIPIGGLVSVALSVTKTSVQISGAILVERTATRSKEWSPGVTRRVALACGFARGLAAATQFPDVGVRTFLPL
jgi:hypothetical protein